MYLCGFEKDYSFFIESTVIHFIIALTTNQI